LSANHFKLPVEGGAEITNPDHKGPMVTPSKFKHTGGSKKTPFTSGRNSKLPSDTTSTGKIVTTKSKFCKIIIIEISSIKTRKTFGTQKTMFANSTLKKPRKFDKT
jgi:hypothetical protein